MNPSLSRLTASTVLLALAAGCYTSTATSQPPRGSLASSAGNAQTLTRTELFFGFSRPNGGADLTDAEFQNFVDAEITPRFPAGLTIIPARGQWREQSGHLARENSRIVLILHDPSNEADRNLDAIRESYKKKFKQEAVMRVDDVERVRF